jgi:spermidine/putrescine transport system ATP-binding protein
MRTVKQLAQLYFTAKGMHRLEKQSIVSLKNISVSFDGEPVLRDFSLDIGDREFVTLLGPSGCGKTTTLRIIGGFTRPDSGDVFFKGRKITNLPPHKREVNTIFQKYALFPHLNVYDNVAFGMRVHGKSEREIKSKVSEMLSMVNLQGFEHRGVNQLSGGQQQRVAIARALANGPKVLLLDEPLGALDMKLRKDMQNELKKIQKQTGITFLFVTHDQEEALSMSDEVVVMDKGAIQQIGTPLDIYNEPKNAFVADFIGESNILDGRMREDYLVEFSGRKFRCEDKGFRTDEPVDVVIRPEDICIIPPDENHLSGTVQNVTFKGVFYEIIVDVHGFKWMIQTINRATSGTEIGFDIQPDGIHVMHKSEYSGTFGDYSSFSDEMDESVTGTGLEAEGSVT